MDNNTLASNIIESLAWPVTAIVILLLLRKELSSLFARVRKGQLGDATVEFEVAVAVVEEKRGARKSADAPASAEDVDMAEADPRAAVIKSWLEVEYQARAAFQRKGVPYTGTAHTPLGKSVEALAELSGVLGQKDLMMFRELQVIRNKYVHDRDFRPSPESVIGYMTLAKDLSEKFKAID